MGVKDALWNHIYANKEPLFLRVYSRKLVLLHFEDFYQTFMG